MSSMAHLCKAESTIFMPIRSGCYRMSNGLSTSADDGPSMADGLCLTQPAVGDPKRSFAVLQSGRSCAAGQHPIEFFARQGCSEEDDRASSDHRRCDRLP